MAGRGPESEAKMTRQQYWRRQRELAAWRERIAEAQLAPHELRARTHAPVVMEHFDRAPRAIRDALNYADRTGGLSWNKLNTYIAKGQIKAALRYIEKNSLEKARENPAEVEAAQAFLKELGL